MLNTTLKTIHAHVTCRCQQRVKAYEQRDVPPGGMHCALSQPWTQTLGGACCPTPETLGKPVEGQQRTTMLRRPTSWDS
jgi:hypothetical protein